MRFAILAALLASTASVFAEDCPPSAKSCKILTLTPEEEAALTQQNGILATAAVGRKIDLEGVANYFAEKIKNAPVGTVKADPAKQEAK